MLLSVNRSPESPAPKHRRKGRQIWLALHLYLGLSAGLVFVLAGLTGSLLVFYVELDEWLNPSLQITDMTTQQPVQSYETILQALKSAHPDRTGAWRLEMPRHAQATLMARYYKPAETEHLHFAPLIAWVNPYTAEVLSNRFWGQYLMTWLYDLHYTLLLDMTGKTIMGCIGGVILVSLISGIYLWWPAPGKLKNALVFKHNASAERFNYDLHKMSGVYSLILLLLLVISGILLELPDFFNPGINRLSSLYVAKANQSMYQTDGKRIPVDQAANIAQQQFPTARLRWIETPKDAGSSYRIMLYQAGEPSQRFPKTTLWIDQYSGKVLDIRNPVNNSAGDTFLNWLHPLHSGEIAGMAGRWLVLVSGFVPLMLFITGVIRWLQKRRAKRLAIRL
ncbi:MAG: PepSY-associated TM helix domain-containing protein [Methylococcales bacterium]